MAGHPCTLVRTTHQSQTGSKASVALSYRRPRRREPGDGVLELGVPDSNFAQAGLVHGGRRGDR